MEAERSRAANAVSAIAKAEVSEAEARQALAERNQELTSTRSKMETDIATVRSRAVDAEKQAKVADAAKAQLRDELAARDRCAHRLSLRAHRPSLRAHRPSRHSRSLRRLAASSLLVRDAVA